MNKIDYEELLNKMIMKAKELPIGTEITTYELLTMAIPQVNTNEIDLMKLDYNFKVSTKKNGLIIDNSIHYDEVIGLPFNIGFKIVKVKYNEQY